MDKYIHFYVMYVHGYVYMCVHVYMCIHILYILYICDTAHSLYSVFRYLVSNKLVNLLYQV